jgi:hypothetical protein
MGFFSARKQPKNLDLLSLEELLFEADVQQDPQVVYRALTRAEALAPEDLAVQRRLLLHGRLHERSPRTMDLSVIPCYALHAFEHPEQHGETAQQEMIRGLFDGERLKRCLALTDAPEQFLADYLLELSRAYMRIFVAPDTSHAPRVFGISLKGSLQRYLAVPARDIVMNILSSPFLSPAESIPLAKAFYRAFYEHAQGDTQALDALLGADICAQLR